MKKRCISRNIGSALAASALIAVVAWITAAPAPSSATKMKAGVYHEEVKGNAFGFKVDVELTESGIKSVKVVSHNDTPGIAEAAIAIIPDAIVKNQSIGVDAVAGATLSSAAIRSAVRQAIVDAGGKPADFSKAVPVPGLTRKEITDPEGTDRGPAAVPAKWDETYDVVVVGGGYAGMAASYAAQVKGAKTVLIEKMPFVGGNSQINGGVWAAYTSDLAEKLQKQYNLVPDTAEKHIEDTMKGGDMKSTLSLVKNMVYGSPFYLNLMLKNGLKVRESLTRPGGHYGYRTYTLEHEQGFDVMEVQKKLNKEVGVTTKLNTKVVRIYRDNGGKGKVVGVATYSPEGVKTIKAEKYVILATGGFSANLEFRTKYVPELTKAYPTTNMLSQTGEGILYAQEVGAEIMQMDYIQLYPFANPNNGVLDVWAVIPFSGPSTGVVYVDYKGERYVNEGERRDVNAQAMINSGGFPCFCILDQEIIDKGGFTSQATINSGIENERVFKADTLEDLAKEIAKRSYRSPSGQAGTVNIAPGKLTETIEKHNGYVTAKKDPDFNKVI
ncbi:MAG: FAD-dependent oxidoreductase, partial [Fusobacteriaceae bacterium]|nr:FAD-dependent oxidoreductase [Fusobacteriaceae bacterium]